MLVSNFMISTMLIETHIKLDMPLHKRYLTQRNLQHAFEITSRDTMTNQATGTTVEKNLALYESLEKQFTWLKSTTGVDLFHLLEYDTFVSVTRNWALNEVEEVITTLRHRQDLKEDKNSNMIWLYFNRLFDHPNDRHKIH